tara:strand:- start:82 stop:405 length:324 start_codon:yes stop_codon:yes gene_type:complete
MIKATRKWLIIKILSGMLIPFMVWFIINFVSLFGANSSQLIVFLSNTSNKIIFSLFLLLAFMFYTFTITEVFEDYIGDIKLKNAANRILVLFSLVMTLSLIIFLFKI